MSVPLNAHKEGLKCIQYIVVYPGIEADMFTAKAALPVHGRSWRAYLYVYSSQCVCLLQVWYPIQKVVLCMRLRPKQICSGTIELFGFTSVSDRSARPRHNKNKICCRLRLVQTTIVDCWNHKQPRKMPFMTVVFLLGERYKIISEVFNPSLAPCIARSCQHETKKKLLQQNTPHNRAWTKAQQGITLKRMVSPFKVFIFEFHITEKFIACLRIQRLNSQNAKRSSSALWRRVLYIQVVHSGTSRWSPRNTPYGIRYNQVEIRCRIN